MKFTKKAVLLSTTTTKNSPKPSQPRRLADQAVAGFPSEGFGIPTFCPPSRISVVPWMTCIVTVHSLQHVNSYELLIRT